MTAVGTRPSPPDGSSSGGDASHSVGGAASDSVGGAARQPNDAFSLPPEVVASLSPVPARLWYRELGSGLVLRHAVPAEYQEVGDVLAAAFTTGCWVTEEYLAGLHAIAERARTANVWVVADDRGILAAVLTPQPRHLDADAFTFNILGVGPRGRGHGLGRVLTDHAVDVARSLGLRTVEIHSGPQMTSAHRVYVDYGFVRRIEQETRVVDGHQRLLSFSYRIPDPLERPPHIDRAVPETAGNPFQTPGESVNIDALRPAGTVDGSGLFLPAAPRRPGPVELPDAPLRLVVPEASPRSWGTVLGARLIAPQWVSVEVVPQSAKDPSASTESAGTGSVDTGGTPRLLAADGSLVSDDWACISRSLATAAGSPLYPAARREEIDRLERQIDEEVIGALEEALFSADQQVRDAVQRLLFARLGLLDLQLGGRAYLLGDRLSTVDLTLFGVLVGWDLHYRAHLGWGAASLVDYPNLWAWARRLLAHDGLVSVDDRVRLGLDPEPDGSYRQPWGPAAPVDGIDDIRAAWREPVEG